MIIRKIELDSKFDILKKSLTILLIIQSLFSLSCSNFINDMNDDNSGDTVTSKLVGQSAAGDFSSANDVVVRGDYAYVTDYLDVKGLRILNISDPSSMHVTATPGYFQGRGVTLSGDYAYVINVGNSALKIINISNPKEPIYAGGLLNISGNLKDVSVSGNYAYLSNDHQGLLIVDIENKSDPKQVGQLKLSTEGVVHGLAVSGNYAYVSSDRELKQIDITNPENPFIVRRFKTKYLAHNVVVSGNYAYVADGFYGLKIIDITEPSESYLVGELDTNDNNNALALTISGNYVYVADASKGVSKIDISEPSNPVLVESFKTSWALGVAVSGDYLYVADASGGIKIFEK